MGEREIRSPWSLSPDQFHERRSESPGSRSSPSKGPDSGHLVRSPGKGPAVRRDGPTFDQPPDANRVMQPVNDRR